MRISRFHVKIVGFIIIALLVARYVIPTQLLGDSADDLLGGCLGLQHKVIYTDFFSHHGPLIYYINRLIFTLLGSCPVYVPQYIFYGIFLGLLFLVFHYTKSTPLVFFLLISYGLVARQYALNTALAETWLSFVAIATFLLLFFHQKI